MSSSLNVVESEVLTGNRIVSIFNLISDDEAESKQVVEAFVELIKGGVFTLEHRNLMVSLGEELWYYPEGFALLPMGHPVAMEVALEIAHLTLIPPEAAFGAAQGDDLATEQSQRALIVQAAAAEFLNRQS